MGWTITSSRQLMKVIYDTKSKIAKKIGVKEGFTIVDLGCGPDPDHPPSFTVCLAELSADNGRVIGVDISDENVKEFYDEARKFRVEGRVSFKRGDAVNLGDIIEDDFADMVVSYRFLEEFMRPKELPQVIREMVRIAKPGGKVCIIELSTKTSNEAEEIFIRLHREWADSFFEASEIAQQLKRNGIVNIQIETFEPDIWYSPSMAKKDFWDEFREEIIAKLGSMTKKYGMKYPPIFIVSGNKLNNNLQQQRLLDH